LASLLNCSAISKTWDIYGSYFDKNFIPFNNFGNLLF